MVFTVATVLDIICTIAFFFTKKSCKLRTKNKPHNIKGKQFYISSYHSITADHVQYLYLHLLEEISTQATSNGMRAHK